MSNLKRTVVVKQPVLMDMPSGTEEKIPTDPTFVAAAPARSYTLTLAPSGGNLNPSLIDNSPPPPNGVVPLSRGPLEMQVFRDCNVTVNLDPAWNWEFDDPAIMISTVNGFGNPPADKRYSNLVRNPPNSPPGTKCLSVTFGARRLPNGPDGKPIQNRDLLNFYVKLNQTMSDGSTVQMSLAIDPDIQNPGCDPNHSTPP